MNSNYRRIILQFKRFASKFTDDGTPIKEKTYKNTKFLDSLRIVVKGGAGGQGFRKYGGIGGKGGDIYAVAKSDETLQDVYIRNPSKRYSALTGSNSRKHVLLGSPGKDVHIKVPVGITVENEDGSVIGSLDAEDDMVCIAKGGPGGSPKNEFNGLKGEKKMVVLNLKLIADIGLVGFPNAGKSTFLSAVSRTKPKISDYPFTTIRPQVATLGYDDFRQITLADLPGLIEGAHHNAGLGHKFLKHVERTKLLLFMVDIQGFRLNYMDDHRSAFETILLLMQELNLYREELIDKPAILALNKIDLDPGHTNADKIIELVQALPDSLSVVDESIRPTRLIKFDEIFKISAKEKVSTDNVKMRVRELLDEYYEQKLQETEVPQEKLDLYLRKHLLKEHRSKKIV